jgi:hypothetical protein
MTNLLFSVIHSKHGIRGLKYKIYFLELAEDCHDASTLERFVHLLQDLDVLDIPCNKQSLELVLLNFYGLHVFEPDGLVELLREMHLAVIGNGVERSFLGV